MAELSPAVIEIAIPVVGALLYALIWFATGNLSRVGKIVARVVPLGLIVPIMLYLSGSGRMPMALNAGTSTEGGEPSSSRAVPSRRSARAWPSPKPSGVRPKRRAPEPSKPRPPPGSRRRPAGARQRCRRHHRRRPPRSRRRQRGPPRPSLRATAPHRQPVSPPPGVPAQPETDWDVVPVFYGTDRVRKDEPKRIAYTRRARAQARTRPRAGDGAEDAPGAQHRAPVRDPRALHQHRHLRAGRGPQAALHDPRDQVAVARAVPRAGARAHRRQRRLQGPGGGVRARLQHHLRLRAVPHRADGLRPQVRRRLLPLQLALGGRPHRLRLRPRKLRADRALPARVPRAGGQGNRRQERQRHRPQHGQHAAAARAAATLGPACRRACSSTRSSWRRPTWTATCSRTWPPTSSSTGAASRSTARPTTGPWRWRAGWRAASLAPATCRSTGRSCSTASTPST